MVVLFLTNDGVVGEAGQQFAADEALGGPVGLGHRGAVPLGVHLQVGSAEPAQGQLPGPPHEVDGGEHVVAVGGWRCRGHGGGLPGGCGRGCGRIIARVARWAVTPGATGWRPLGCGRGQRTSPVARGDHDGQSEA